jgi:Protein of unknown function (DUF3551)
MYRSSLRAAATTALALACLSLVVAHEAYAATRRPTATIATTAPMRTGGYPWCLQYDSATDCSFSARNQCEATASGGLGECVYIRPGAQPGD